MSGEEVQLRSGNVNNVTTHLSLKADVLTIQNLHPGIGDINHNQSQLDPNVLETSPSSNAYPSEDLSETTLEFLNEICDKFMQDKKYEMALKVLQKEILVRQEEANQILTLLKITECQIGVGQHIPAVKSLNALEVTVKNIKNCQHQSLPKDMVNECCAQFRSLADKFSSDEVKLFKPALSLQRCLLSFIKLFCKGQLKLDKLIELSYNVQHISKQLSKHQNNNLNMNYINDLMEEGLKEVEKTDNVDSEIKNKQIANFLHYYGIFYERIKDYKTAISTYQKVISCMETKISFADKSFKFGDSIHNLGNAFLNSNRLDEAFACYKRAMTVYNQATDWSNKQQKTYRISRINQDIQKIQQTNGGEIQRREIVRKNLSWKKRLLSFLSIKRK